MSDKQEEIEIEKDEIPVEDIKELMKVVNEEVPGLIKGLLSALYSAETAEQYAQGIATIYKTLNDQGLPPEMVQKMVMKYADSINIIGKAMQNIDLTTKKRSED